jgi:hypothetical protein
MYMWFRSYKIIYELKPAVVYWICIKFKNHFESIYAKAKFVLLLKQMRYILYYDKHTHNIIYINNDLQNTTST